jgi:hypothetical protein
MQNPQSPEEPQEKPDPDTDPPPDFWSRRRWLARLSFSFLIVAVYLVWTGTHHPEFGQGRRMLFYVGAALAFVLFLMGTRERHRPLR